MGVVQKLFGKYLLVTNTVSSGLMMAAGDFIQQQSSSIKKLLEDSNKVIAASQENSIADDSAEKSVVTKLDYTRTINMTTVGLVHGTFNHYFYTMLDRALPGKNVLSIVKKTVIDQSIASPTTLTIFFVGLGYLERRELQDIKEECKLKFRDAWKMDICFWPPTQLINFLFVPQSFRVLYISLMTMVFDIILSRIKYDAEF